MPFFLKVKKKKRERGEELKALIPWTNVEEVGLEFLFLYLFPVYAWSLNIKNDPGPRLLADWRKIVSIPYLFTKRNMNPLIDTIEK